MVLVTLCMVKMLEVEKNYFWVDCRITQKPKAGVNNIDMILVEARNRFVLKADRCELCGRGEIFLSKQILGA